MTIMTHDVIDSPAYEVIAAGCAGGRERFSMAAAQLRKLCTDAQAAAVAAKLDHAAELLKRRQTRDAALREQQAARRNMPVGSAPGVSSMDDFLAQYRRETDMDKRCAEAKAAYDARNPHKRKEAQT